MNKRILIIDDEPNVRLSYRAVLEAERYVAEEASSAATGLEKLVAGPFRPQRQQTLERNYQPPS